MADQNVNQGKTGVGQGQQGQGQPQQGQGQHRQGMGGSQGDQNKAGTTGAGNQSQNQNAGSNIGKDDDMEEDEGIV